MKLSQQELIESIGPGLPSTTSKEDIAILEVGLGGKFDATNVNIGFGKDEWSINRWYKERLSGGLFGKISLQVWYNKWPEEEYGYRDDQADQEQRYFEKFPDLRFIKFLRMSLSLLPELMPDFGDKKQ
ncbi:hypothetical protein GIB67_009255 [Kingdonia uniflora]|uniref:Uncharacterized protein n=1 Tax=Kingdonia uniflora TaxID=39325 RepID=A0A7J7N2N3_9MAGN|nr:hypothetical protein GIB67_009255 [Kingdonia uniflora]